MAFVILAPSWWSGIRKKYKFQILQGRIFFRKLEKIPPPQLERLPHLTWVFSSYPLYQLEKLPCWNFQLEKIGGNSGRIYAPEILRILKLTFYSRRHFYSCVSNKRVSRTRGFIWKRYFLISGTISNKRRILWKFSSLLVWVHDSRTNMV